MIILDYKGEEIRLEGNTITTANALTKTLAKNAVEQFEMWDLTDSYFPNNESIVAAALEKYMKAKVVSMVNEAGNTDEALGKQKIY